MPSSTRIARFSESFTWPAEANRISTISPGARRSRTKMTTDMPKSVSRAMASRCATYVFTRIPGRATGEGRCLPRSVAGAAPAPLLVRPHFLQAAVVVEGLVRDQVLDVGPVGEELDAPHEHGPHRLLLDLALD